MPANYIQRLMEVEEETLAAFILSKKIRIAKEDDVYDSDNDTAAY